MPIVIFICILGVVIFVHELGHYIAARCTNTFVEEFALGMGPKILSRKGRQHPCGEQTIYSLRLLPIGGFCRMRGEESVSNDDPVKQATSLDSKKPIARLWVTINGSLFNFVFAFAVFAVYAVVAGFPVSTVSHVMQGSPAQYAGVLEGDRITHFNGQRVRMWADMALLMSLYGDGPIDLRVQRGEYTHTLTVTPVADATGQPIIGITPDIRLGSMQRNVEGFSWPTSGEVLTNASDNLRFSVTTPLNFLGRLITGRLMLDEVELVGPIGLASQITMIYDDTIEQSTADMAMTMVLVTGIISAAVGVMNLLPIPALDGGRTVFIIIEMIRRKPLRREWENLIHGIGLAALLCIMAFVTFMDIQRLIG